MPEPHAFDAIMAVDIRESLSRSALAADAGCYSPLAVAPRALQMVSNYCGSMKL